MTYILHNRPGSGGFVIEAALDVAGADWRLEPVDSPVSTPLPESFRAVNPVKQIPVLDLPDGSRMTESAAMLIHLAAAFPESGLAPPPGTPAHAQFLRWTVFLSNAVYEAVLRRTYPERYTADPAGADAVRQAALAKLDQGFAVLEDAIGGGGFLLGERMTATDIYLAMMYYWHDRLRGGLPKCTAITRAVRAHPKVAPSWRRNFERG